MAKKQKHSEALDFTGTQYNLIGHDGNAFVIMGRVRNLLKEFGREHLVSQYSEEAKAGDYKNLILVSDRYVQFDWVFQAGDEWEEFEERLLAERLGKNGAGK